MKKLILLMVMLAAVAVQAETSKYGSMWKQEDTTVSPADDVTIVDFSNVSTIGVSDGGGGGSSFVNISVTDTAYIKNIVGGTSTTNAGDFSGIGGGSGISISATGDYGFIGGGADHSLTKTYGFIGGGDGHTMVKAYSVICGGVNNYINGAWSVICGGTDHLTTGEYVFIAGGKNANLDANADRVFADVYGDSDVNISTPNVHIIYGEAGYEKKVGIQTLDPESTLHVPDGYYAQFENYSAGVPLAGDCDADAERGRLFIDTGNNRLYICNGAARGWDYTALTD